VEFVTADLHLDHEGIIDICNRPFKNTKIMANQLSKNWNSVVKDGDIVYIIGDLSMEGAQKRYTYEHFLKKLKGRKRFIPGNHDIDKYRFYAGDQGIGFEQIIYPWAEVEEFVLAHDPTLSIVLPDRPFITGHVHQMWHTIKNCYNCGVDVNNYTPVSIDVIRTYFREHTHIKVKD